MGRQKVLATYQVNTTWMKNQYSFQFEDEDDMVRRHTMIKNPWNEIKTPDIDLMTIRAILSILLISFWAKRSFE